MAIHRGEGKEPDELTDSDWSSSKTPMSTPVDEGGETKGGRNYTPITPRPDDFPVGQGSPPDER